MTFVPTADKLWTGVMIMTNNLFENSLVLDVFVLDVLEKIANDWKNSCHKESYTRDEFEQFVINELPIWFMDNLEDFLNEEFGEEDDE